MISFQNIIQYSICAGALLTLMACDPAARGGSRSETPRAAGIVLVAPGDRVPAHGVGHSGPRAGSSILEPGATDTPRSGMHLSRSGPGQVSRAHPWRVIRGESLRETLRRWGQHAGVAIFWETCAGPDSCLDWRNQVDAAFTGQFDDALVWLLEGHGEAEPRPVAVRSSNAAVRILADGPALSGRQGGAR